MARTRLLKPGFFKNELLAELPFEGRLLFEGLWTLADREGRLEDRPLRIKAEVFPFDNVKVDELLAGLAERGFILRYQVEALAVIQVVKFSEHQTPHLRESPSVLPKPSKGDGEALPRPPVSVPVFVSVSVSSDSTEPPTAASELASMLTFPCVGSSKEWPLLWSQVQGWEALYPGLPVELECRKALAWVQAQPARRKTAGGMPKFLVGWLNRSVNDRRQTPRGTPDRRSNWEPLRCPHTPECHGRAACAMRSELDALKAQAPA